MVSRQVASSLFSARLSILTVPLLTLTTFPLFERPMTTIVAAEAEDVFEVCFSSSAIRRYATADSLIEVFRESLRAYTTASYRSPSSVSCDCQSPIFCSTAVCKSLFFAMTTSLERPTAIRLERESVNSPTFSSNRETVPKLSG